MPDRTVDTFDSVSATAELVNLKSQQPFPSGHFMLTHDGKSFVVRCAAHRWTHKEELTPAGAERLRLEALRHAIEEHGLGAHP